MPLNPTLEDVAKALCLQDKAGTSEFHAWGVVKRVSADGKAEVAMNQSQTATCSVPRSLSLSVNDRVLVCGLRNGETVVINAY